MLLKLHKSNTTNTATLSVLDSLGRQNTIGSRHIVIVPDRFSLSIEQDIFQRLGLPGAFNIDVVSFTRLAIKSLKDATPKFLSKEGTVILLKKIISDNLEKLIHYKKVAVTYGFAKEMFAVIASFRNSGYSPEDMEAIASKLPSGTSNKIKDIALILREYSNEIIKNYADTTTRLDALINTLPSLQEVKQTHFYIVGFNYFSAHQQKIIKTIIKNALSIDIACTPTNFGANSNIYPSETYDNLLSIATDLSATIEEIEQFQILKEPFDVLNRELFSYREVIAQKNSDRIVISIENTPYQEIEGIAKEIAMLTHKGLARYKDIAIVNCNSEYLPIYKETFSRFKIPIFFEQKYRTADTALARFIMSALEALQFNFRIDKVLKFVKTPLFGAEYDDIETFENYCLAYNISYNKILSPFIFGNDDIRETSSRISNKIVQLLPITIKDSKSVSSLVNAIYNLMSLVKENNDNYINNTIKPRDALYYACNSQSYGKIDAILAEMLLVLKDDNISLQEFISIFGSAINASEISLVPQNLDSVFIGNIDESRYHNVKYLFLVGASASVFPNCHKYQAIISARDFDLLNFNGIKLFPSPLDKIVEEQFIILDLLTKPQVKLYITYPSFALNGEAETYSSIVTELIRIANPIKTSLSQQYSLLNADCNDLNLALVTTNNAIFEGARGQSLDANRYKLDGVIADINSFFTHQQESSKSEDENLLDYYFALDRDGRRQTKVSQIESYFNCPYKHHLQYGLKLKERVVSKLKIVDIGIIIHNVLEHYFRFSLGKIDELSEKEIDELATKSIKIVLADEKLIGLKDGAIGNESLRAIARECNYAIKALTNNVKNSSFKPKFIECGFGMGQSEFDAIDIKCDIASFKLRGKIDRIDTYNDQIIIIDYKTGGTSKLSNLSDVYYGTKIQLYIYLKALMAVGKHPAGVFYLPITDGYSKDAKKYVFWGQYLDDTTTLFNLDNKIFDIVANSESSKVIASDIIPLKLKKSKDDLINPTESQNRISENDFQTIIDYTQDISKMALEEIASGYKAKRPIDSCKNCNYIAVCGGAEICDIRYTQTAKILKNKQEGNDNGEQLD